MRAHLKQIQKTTGHTPKQLIEAKDFPKDLGYIWELFCELKGTGAVSYSEIKAWCDLMKVQLNANEIQLIRKLDRIHSEVLHHE